MSLFFLAEVSYSVSRKREKPITGKEKMKKRRVNGAGTLIRQSTGLYLAKWIYGGKTYVRSTKTHVRLEAEKRLAEFVKPFQESNDVAVLQNIQTKIRNVEEGEDKRSSIPIQKMFEMYINDPCSNTLEASSKMSYKGVVKKFVDWIEKEHPNVVDLKSVTRLLIKEYLVHLSKTVKTSTYNKDLVILKRVFGVLLGDRSMFKSFGIKRVNDAFEKRALSKDEVERIMETVSNKPLRWRLLFTVGLYTGLRLSDCCNLRWKNVDFENRLIRVLPIKTRRFHREVVIPMHPKVFDVLMEQKIESQGNSEYVNDSNCQTYRKKTMLFGVNDILVESGVKKKNDVFGFHILRHTFVSMCANNGVPLAFVKEIVGHSTEDMTRRYFHADIGIASQYIAKLEIG